MKYSKILLLLFAASLFACTQSPSSTDHKNDSISIVTSKKPAEVDADSLIIPGKAIGKLYLKQDVKELEQILGKADDGDAAMGKAWGIWYDQVPNSVIRNEIDVYSSYADTGMVKKDIKQIRITANSFSSSDQLRTGNDISTFMDKYSDAKKLSIYLDAKTKDSIVIYDSSIHGIGIESVKNKITAITIHQKGTAVNETYLTLHPEWKLLR